MRPGSHTSGSLKDFEKTVVIESVAPAVDGGRYPVKREVGDVVEVSADIFREGHEVLLAFLKFRRFDQDAWRESPMRFADNDRWAGTFRLAQPGRHVFTIEALPDLFRSWVADLIKRVDAGQDVRSELVEGAALVRAAAARARGDDQRALLDAAARIGGGVPTSG